MNTQNHAAQARQWKPTRKERRDMRKASDRVDRRGLDCCGSSSSTIHPTLMVMNNLTKRYEVWHVECLAAKPAGKAAVAVHASFADDMFGRTDDLRWFDEHPGESRIRKPHPEEWFALLLRRKVMLAEQGVTLAETPPALPERQQVIVMRNGEAGRCRIAVEGSREDAEQMLAADAPAVAIFSSQSAPSAQNIVLSAALKAFNLTKTDAFDDADEVFRALCERENSGGSMQ
jgi:hypothetical protein